jgi:hypothetical protein
LNCSKENRFSAKNAKTKHSRPDILSVSSHW